MQLGWKVSLFLSAITCLLPLNACRKSPSPPEPEIPPVNPVSINPVSNIAPVPDISWQTIEIHRASQEMALDGFQYGKTTLGWPFEIGAVSSEAYLTTLIRENLLPPEAVKWFDHGWQIANLSDADPGETAFLKVTQSDQSVVIVRKDGQRAVFQDEASAAPSIKEPPREPAWLP
jgi:hypothetical protein